jgi:prolyl-tRNA synthetase
MKTSQYLIASLREEPNDADVISHRLMLRSGMIRQQASGLYTWLPTGLRVLKKIETIIRQAMNQAGANEILMPILQSADLWKESGRWGQYGSELLRLQDRHQRDFCLGPTHEEIITSLVRDEIRSYKQLPCTFFQIQNKFRDEPRPRFGVMRAREFLMKDAYSFHENQACLDTTYKKMHAVYESIFSSLSLHYCVVDADSGAIGGLRSHEFQVLAESGEDAIVLSQENEKSSKNKDLSHNTSQDSFSKQSLFKHYAANIEKARACLPDISQRLSPKKAMTSYILDPVHSQKSEQIQVVFVRGKTLSSKKVDSSIIPLIAIVLRGDHQLNETKITKHALVASPLEYMTEDMIPFYTPENNNIQNQTPWHWLTKKNASSHIQLKAVIADYEAAMLSDFIGPSNLKPHYLMGLNWDRDVYYDEVFDCRNVLDGDKSPDGQGTLIIKRGIEVGHIFQLGTQYSQQMKANVLMKTGKSTPLTMGCYGMGVSRMIAAIIEQNHDDYGIIWPEKVAPFQLVIIPMNMHKFDRVKQLAYSIYDACLKENIEVLLDDRKERPGVMFADMELIGIPHRIVVSERGIDDGTLEYKHRRTSKKESIAIDSVLSQCIKKIQNGLNTSSKYCVDLL